MLALNIDQSGSIDRYGNPDQGWGLWAGIPWVTKLPKFLPTMQCPGKVEVSNTMGEMELNISSHVAP